MNKWLLKTEPSEWSWDMQVKAKITTWNGVRNYQATNYLKLMKIGDLAFFYHSGQHPEIVGIVKVYREWYLDPLDDKKKFVNIEVETVSALSSIITLAKIKNDKRLKHLALIKQSRLSVMPIDNLAWNIILEL